jgi:hypothetical protein
MTRLTAVTLTLLGILLHSIGIMLQKKGANGLNFGQLLKNLRKLKLKITSDLGSWPCNCILYFNTSDSYSIGRLVLPGYVSDFRHRYRFYYCTFTFFSQGGYTQVRYNLWGYHRSQYFCAMYLSGRTEQLIREYEGILCNDDRAVYTFCARCL